MDKRKNQDYSLYYKIINIIGNGVSSIVFKGMEIKTGGLRAIKVIDLNKIKENILLVKGKENIEKELKNCVEGFIQEFENMEICSKNNNNSVKCYEYFNNKDNFVIIMELCDKNLSKLLTEKIINNKEEIFNIKELLEILSQLNNTFKIMKENKIIHRDLKLENILIKYDDKDQTKFTIKLADYGSSKKLNSLSKNYLNSNVGTFIYNAPEILKGEKYNYKCDLWSLGIIIYCLKFGKSPFFGETEIALLKNINNFNDKLLKNSGNNDLDDLIKKLLEKVPEKRLNWDEYLKHNFFNEIKRGNGENNENKLLNSLVKIEKNEEIFSEGFFLKIEINKKLFHFLVICNEVIGIDYVERKEEINIYFRDNYIDKRKIKLDSTQRLIQVFYEPRCIAFIEILEKDNIPKDIYLNPDLDYQKGNDIYDKKKLYLAGYSNYEIKNSKMDIYPGEIKSIIKEYNILFKLSLDNYTCIEGSPICLKDTRLFIGIYISYGYGLFIGQILDELKYYIENGKNKNEKKQRNKIKYLSEKEKSRTKLCNKCGEIYFILVEGMRQGDMKNTPHWSITGRSGIREPKEGIETCVLRSFFTQFEPWIWEPDDDDEDYDIINCISHYDDHALEEIDKGNCIMKGCNGNLLNIELERPPFVSNNI